MDVNEILKNNPDLIKSIIAEFNIAQEFSSHDFIERFTAKCESAYIEMLIKYQSSGRAFQTVHSQIARYLSLNKSDLGIEKTRKGESENIHGKLDSIHWWKRVN